MQEKIFEPFAQVSRFAGGTGLGLPICRRYARLMGGELTMTSEEGRGSTFLFGVTLRPGHAPPTEPPRAQAFTVADLPALRILVAEDTPVSAMVIRTMLQRLGHGVRVTADGRQAVTAFAEEEFDLVFLDIQMPVMDGLDAAREIRRHPRGAEVAIVALSALATEADRENARASGIDEYLVKPIRSADIGHLIARLARPPSGPTSS
jgi:CheY-like chemotaxis protein